MERIQLDSYKNQIDNKNQHKYIMGGLCSTQQFKKDNNNIQDTSVNNMNSSNVTIHSEAEYDQKFVDALRKEFKSDLESFLLNHILMSVLYFENYERDMKILTSSVSEWEKLYNRRMITEHQKQCLMPDIVFEHSTKNIRFRPFHGEKKTVSEPISSQRLYIIHDNIEIPDPHENSEYSKIDKPAYKGFLEESSEHKGYVKVKQIELIEKKSHQYDIMGRQYSDESLYETLQSKDEPSTSGVSTIHSSDSEYDYARLSEFRTPAPLHIEESDIYTEVGTLPSKCLTPVRMKNRSLDEDSDDENDNYISKAREKSKLFIYVNYFNSREFMIHFTEKVFPNVLGNALGFTKDEILSATSAECKIYCKTFDENGNVIQCEVIPAIAIPWPTLAFEWLARNRPTITDTRAMIRYKWPTENMIREIKSMNCVIVPQGYMPKKNKQTNPMMQLEWEVAFPKAERYLETRMSHAQMRCYLTLLTLYKTFIEPVTLTYGLRPEHVRTLLFWECERNYMSWSDCKLWWKLKELLKKLDQSLSICSLSDYFIRNKNVFENIQKKYLLAAQSAIFRILESPVPHLIKALRNLRCMSGKFYPTPDLRKLYEILVSRSSQFGIPSVYLSTPNTLLNGQHSKRRKSTNPDKDQEWRLRALEKQKMERMRKTAQQQHRETGNLNDRRTSVDSVDISNFEKLTVDDIKRRSILIFFIDHFISIAKTSNRIGSMRQTLFYLKQAWYLTRLLADSPANQQDVITYEGIIGKEEELCHRIADKPSTSSPTPPSPPPNTLARVHSNVQSMNHMRNLTSQNSNELEETISSSTTKRKSILKHNEYSEKTTEKRTTISFRAELIDEETNL